MSNEPQEGEKPWPPAFSLTKTPFFSMIPPFILTHLQLLKGRQGFKPSKMGMDATLPLGVAYPEVCDVSKEVMKNVEENWQQYLKG
jgi:hypothetical protein